MMKWQNSLCNIVKHHEIEEIRAIENFNDADVTVEQGIQEAVIVLMVTYQCNGTTIMTVKCIEGKSNV